MGKYGVFFNAFATTTSAKTALGFHANATGEMAEIVELLMTGSGSAAAADRQHRAQGAFCTFGTAGTGTVITAEPFQQASNAAKILATGEFSGEPVTVDAVFPILYGFNQRGGMRWAVPRGEGVNIHAADTTPGFVFQVLSDAAGEVDGHGHWWEP
jgi:hypothetical protein